MHCSTKNIFVYSIFINFYEYFANIKKYIKNRYVSQLLFELSFLYYTIKYLIVYIYIYIYSKWLLLKTNSVISENLKKKSSSSAYSKLYSNGLEKLKGKLKKFSSHHQIGI